MLQNMLLVFAARFTVALDKMGSLSNNEGDGNENVIWKVNSRCFKLSRDKSISFNSANVGRLFWSSSPKDCIVVQEKKKKAFVLCPRTSPPKNVKLGSFTS